MSTTAFLPKALLWRELGACVKRARHVDAAVAYLGQGGGDLLPLRAGHRLVVNLSIPTVRAGATNPMEVERLMDRGVEVYSRRDLHAKLIIADETIICSSANISKNSRDVLDEVGILTTDPTAVREARTYFSSICIERVGREFLAICKEEYRPPKQGGDDVGTQGGPEPPPAPAPATNPKLWIVKLRQQDLPQAEQQHFKEGLAVATKKLAARKASSKVESFWWPYKPRMADHVDNDTWVIQAMTLKKSDNTRVYVPGRFLHLHHFPRGPAQDKERWVFHIEVPVTSQSMTWARFRRIATALPGLAKLTTPRTRSVSNSAVADRLLALWTSTGELVSE